MPSLKAVLYRDYLIEYCPESFLPASLAWTVTHRDYDGGYYESDGLLSPESDMRHTRVASAEEGIEWVDWREDE